jgi:CPA2 family monovalent cation:H+ antiporter-2
MFGLVGTTFLENLALVLCIGAIATILCQALRQPVVVGYLVAGMLLGPYLPFPLFADLDSVQELAEFGVILLMFALGLEFSLRRLLKLGPTAGFITVVQVGLMIWLGYLCGQALGWTELESLFAGAIVSISSTTIVAKAFDEERVTGRLRDLVLGVLLCEDLAAVLLLAILTTLAAGAAVSTSMMAITMGRLALFLVVIIVGGLLLVPPAIRLILRFGRAETTLVASIGICFAFAMFAEEAGYSVALGAFLGGSLVAESGESHQIEHLVAPVRDMFGAVFFVSVGMLIDPRIISQYWFALIVLTAVVVLGKIIGVTSAAFLTGAGTRASVQAGMSLAQIGEFSFIIAGVGLATKATGDFLYTLAVAVSTITTFLTPLLIRASGRTGDYVDRLFPEPVGTLESLYGAWMERLRRARDAERLRWPIAALIACAGAMTASFIGTEVFKRGEVIFVEGWHPIADRSSRLVVDIAAYVLAAPFAAGCYFAARRIAERVAMRAFPRGDRGEPALERGSADALSEMLKAIILIAVVMPTLAIAAPFMEPEEGIAMMLIAMVLIGAKVWRTATMLRGRLRAASAALGAALRRAPALRPDARATLVEGEMIEGFGTITPVRIDARSVAAGMTLDQLDLRGATGATVVAVARGKDRIVVPDGSLVVREGDILGLVGPHDSVRAALELLRPSTGAAAD